MESSTLEKGTGAITMIWSVLCSALEKGNIAGPAMNFGFYIIAKTFSNFPHSSWSHCLFMLSNSFQKKSQENITKFLKIFFPEINKSVLLFINHIQI